jgi:hypothetical protein
MVSNYLEIRLEALLEKKKKKIIKNIFIFIIYSSQPSPHTTHIFIQCQEVGTSFPILYRHPRHCCCCC